jgi:hypothetical protein
MKQTAVECLAKEIQEQLNMFFPDATLYQPTIDKAKEMEKEQIIEAYGNVCFDEDGNYLTAEQYYNETFKAE